MENRCYGQGQEQQVVELKRQCIKAGMPLIHVEEKSKKGNLNINKDLEHFYDGSILPTNNREYSYSVYGMIRRTASCRFLVE